MRPQKPDQQRRKQSKGQFASCGKEHKPQEGGEMIDISRPMYLGPTEDKRSLSDDEALTKAWRAKAEDLGINTALRTALHWNESGELGFRIPSGLQENAYTSGCMDKY